VSAARGGSDLIEGDLHLHPAFLEVQRQRHERDAGIAQPPDGLVDLAAVQEQFAGTPGMVEGAGAVAAVGVLGDVQAVEHQLAVVLLDEPPASDAWPARRDFTSLPIRTIPASYVLRIV